LTSSFRRCRWRLNPSLLQLEHQDLVEIRRLDGEADPAGQLAASFRELKLGRLR
jgi:hypothetical protein